MDTNPIPAPARPARVLLDARRLPYQPAVGPRLRLLLAVIFAAVALLGATGVYLLAIRLLNAATERTYTNQFTLWMFLVHVLGGVVILLPFVVFGTVHFFGARHRKNRLAVRLGIVLFQLGLVVCATGVALIQVEQLPQLPTGTTARFVTYLLHVAVPVLAVGVYVLHRRAGPDINWTWGKAWAGGVAVFTLAMIALHAQDPRQWYARGPVEGERYFEPSKMRTVTGNFIPAEVLMMDDYCLKCHADIHRGWFHSAHHFSSFNNPPYRFSVRETRAVALKRDGNTRASRWCAGCHDVVPFLSGAFDDANYDDVNHPTAHAGITCTSCHAITNVNSTIGNADVTVEEPIHYPLAFSKSPLLQYLNNQLIKAKPDFHKQMFLKPFHKTAEFCAACHKVSIPIELNHYKEFLRGQNHYDPFLLSGVSGHGARSFYYPPQARTKCADCHMPLAPSHDFGARDFDGSGVRKVHDHGFVGANTGLPYLLIHEPRYAEHREGFQKRIDAHRDFLRDHQVRIDLFGLKEGGMIDSILHAPLRPALPKLKLGATYLVEVVIRTLNMGHPFPQGTADSNEIWVDFQAISGGRTLGRSGALSGPDDAGTVDPWSHFVNVHMLDRDGNRINRRNPQDIFTPLYDHQIPPGAAQVVHYALKVPEDVKAPIELKVRLRYRKFDFEYLSLVYGGPDKVPTLPIVDLCEDRVTLPVTGIAEAVPAQTSPINLVWQRWNDYGIGCYLEGGAGSKKGELRQAEEAFRRLLTLGEPDAIPHAHLNLARVLFDEGRLQETVDALNRAREAKAPWWTVAWFTGLVNAQNGHLDAAIENLAKIVDPDNQPWDRKFDFTKDYVVLNELASTLFKRSQQEDDAADRDRFLRQAVEKYEATLQIDAEDLDAHFGLAQCYERLGESCTLKGADEVPARDDTLTAAAKVFADPQGTTASKPPTAVWLSVAIGKFGEESGTVGKQKLPALLALTGTIKTVYRSGDADLRVVAAHLLGRLYRQTHRIYKPDDNARDRTVRLYRQKNPAADLASQAIVIYPTNRPGAPGL